MPRVGPQDEFRYTRKVEPSYYPAPTQEIELSSTRRRQDEFQQTRRGLDQDQFLQTRTQDAFRQTRGRDEFRSTQRSRVEPSYLAPASPTSTSQYSHHEANKSISSPAINPTTYRKDEMCLGECCSCFACISTGEVGVIERNCKYNRLASPGIVFLMCPFEAVRTRVSLRITQLDVACETKTQDNVFVMVHVSVQYQVIRLKVYDAVYRLTNPAEQIRAYVFDVVRATLPHMDLDEAFEAKETIAKAIKEQLTAVMEQYGFLILQALVTDLEPDGKVRAAMNEINASKRLKEAARERAEGDKILMIKSAEASSESKYLSGVGVAKQRKAIVDGLRESIMDFSGNVPGTTAKDVMDLLLLTQYFDMLGMVGGSPTTTSVFVPHKPHTGGGGMELADMIRDGTVMADRVPRVNAQQIRR